MHKLFGRTVALRFAATACDIVGASVAIKIASNPKKLPIFRLKRLSMGSNGVCHTAASDYAMRFDLIGLQIARFLGQAFL